MSKNQIKLLCFKMIIFYLVQWKEWFSENLILKMTKKVVNVIKKALESLWVTNASKPGILKLINTVFKNIIFSQGFSLNVEETLGFQFQQHIMSSYFVPK